MDTSSGVSERSSPLIGHHYGLGVRATTLAEHIIVARQNHETLSGRIMPSKN